MLKYIELKNFKCFNEIEIDLSTITILTGMNSSGKSTIIQAISLLKQSLDSNSEISKIIFNGTDISLGSFSDIVSFTSDRSYFSINLKTVDNLEFISVCVENETQPRIGTIVPPPDGSTIEFENRKVGEVLERLIKISSERIGPLDIYPAETDLNQGVGADGRFTPAYINIHKDAKVSGARAFGSSINFITLLNKYVNNFFPSYTVQALEIEGTNSISLRIDDIKLGKSIKPAHVGFGISNMLPILAAGLGASPRDIIIIENPEIHLHPKAQSQLAEFLCTVALDGVQIIVETHSDHIINGFRKFVKSGKINPSDISTYFFKNSDLTLNTGERVERLHLDSDGSYNKWPVDFFDQLDRDLESLVSWE